MHIRSPRPILVLLILSLVGLSLLLALSGRRTAVTEDAARWPRTPARRAATSLPPDEATDDPLEASFDLWDDEHFVYGQIIGQIKAHDVYMGQSLRGMAFRVEEDSAQSIRAGEEIVLLVELSEEIGALDLAPGSWIFAPVMQMPLIPDTRFYFLFDHIIFNVEADGRLSPVSALSEDIGLAGLHLDDVLARIRKQRGGYKP